MARVPLIDLVRFGSILLVLGEHFFPQWLSQFIQPVWLQSWVLHLFRHGNYGVICFFVVSGYLITQMLVEQGPELGKIDLLAFYVRRAARILPLLLLVVLVSISLDQLKGVLDPRLQNYRVWNDETSFGWTFWVSLLSLNFNWYLISHYALQGFQWNVLWSLAVEEQFYLGYPWLLKRLGERKNIYIFLGLVILSGWAFRWSLFVRWGQEPFFPALSQMASFSSFDQIALGAALYFAREKWGSWLGHRSWVCAVLWVAGFTGCLYLCGSTEQPSFTRSVLEPGFMALSCALALLGGLQLSFFNTEMGHLLSWPGKLSYGCYLWHPTLIFLWMPILMAVGGFGSFICLLFGVFLFSFLSYRYFETPVNHWVRGRFGLAPSAKG